VQEQGRKKESERRKKILENELETMNAQSRKLEQL